MPEFVIANWVQQLRKAESSNWKEPLYKLARPFLDFWARRELQEETLLRFQPNLVLRERGFPLCARQKWGYAYKSLQDKVILIQGTGNGWDAASWAQYKPKKIFAVDLFPFDSWHEVAKYAQQRFGVEVEFHASPLHRLPFLDNEAVDTCVSHTVLEHVKNLPDVMRETYRVLRQTGPVYASYGPLWYCAGGDHFARGGLQNSYNHILLEPDEYSEYVEQYKNVRENFQAGGRYIEMDLFSKFRSEEYLDTFAQSGFEIDALILEVSSRAIRFRQNFPDLYEQVKQKNKHCMPDDFIIGAHMVRLRKPKLRRQEAAP